MKKKVFLSVLFLFVVFLAGRVRAMGDFGEQVREVMGESGSLKERFDFDKNGVLSEEDVRIFWAEYHMRGDLNSDGIMNSVDYGIVYPVLRGMEK